MVILKNNFYIITGGPGVGKTALINELERRGYNCVPEVAREIIKQQVSDNGDALPWKDTKKYSDLMLSYSVRDFIYLSEDDNFQFFDRGIPDTYGYELLMKFDENKQLIDALNNYRYNKTAFVLPPCEDIYVKDEERKQDFRTAVDTYNVMKQAYGNAKYNLIEIPFMTVSGRADFLLDHILI